MNQPLPEVPFSKNKLLVYASIAFLILLMGLDMFFDSRKEQGFMHYFGQVFGMLSILLFGSGWLLCLILLIRSKKGLVFMPEGFRDFTCLGFSGLVKWGEIEKVERFEIYGQKYIRVQLKDPHGFISASKGWSRFLFRLNFKLYGTPLFISPLLLQSGFDDLYKQVNFHWSTAIKAVSIAG